MARIPAQRRPHYAPQDRLAILCLRAANGWSLAATARRFLVADSTMRIWTSRCDESGPEALLRAPEPVNRFPDCVTAVVQQLAASLPAVGRRRIAALLARAGLHLSPSTVLRRLRQPPPARSPTPVDTSSSTGKTANSRTVIARYPGHVWSSDLTVVPIGCGLGIPFFPWSLPQRWPLAWWLLVTIDHFSRAIVHVAVFRRQPTAALVCKALDEAVAISTGPPKYMVTDQGSQFQELYRDWCEALGIRPRFGAIGKTGSIAVTERLIRTLKSEGFRRFLLPFSTASMLTETALLARWYNEYRPHSHLGAATPDEVRSGQTPANQLPRFETRQRYPAKHPVRSLPGVGLELQLDHLEGRSHLPIVSLRVAA